jgi:hypothetical protein
MTHCPEGVSPLLPGIASIVLDRATATATIITFDGRTESFPVSSPFDPISLIVKSTHVPNASILSLETDRGDTIVAELPTLEDPAPRSNRPVVYLDQNHWSLLANALYQPTKAGSAIERDAAEQLISLARERMIILPMSFGHMGETARWTNTERRYRLALTVTELSRGWQMRYPLDIRGFELRQSLATRIKHDPMPPLDMFTLEACAAQPVSTVEHLYGTRAGLLPEMAYVVDALTCISSYFDSTLSSEAVQPNPIPGCASENQEFTTWLSREPKNSPQKRGSIKGRFLADLRLEMIQAALESGITSEELGMWLDLYFDVDVRAMGSLGLFNEVYQDKHLNPETVWRSNDLSDMMYLTCAAGYADFVVGERSLVSHIKQSAKRLQRTISIYPRISDLVVALKSTGI